MSDTTDELFANNRRWAADIEQRIPGFFTKLLEQQKPQYLWIGCADSRVPANELIGLLPGDVFVHRNVANVVTHSDLNALSVIQFAVDALQVQHIMVVGHSRCGGVRAVLDNTRLGLADNWLQHVRDVRNMHQVFLDGVDPERRIDALVELNVLEQVRNVCHTTVVQDAWNRGQQVVVHGWVYELHNGLLQDLKIRVSQVAEIAAVCGTALGAIQQRYARPRSEQE